MARGPTDGSLRCSGEGVLSSPDDNSEKKLVHTGHTGDSVNSFELPKSTNVPKDDVAGTDLVSFGIAVELGVLLLRECSLSAETILLVNGVALGLPNAHRKDGLSAAHVDAVDASVVDDDIAIACAGDVEHMTGCNGAIGGEGA